MAGSEDPSSSSSKGESPETTASSAADLVMSSTTNGLKPPSLQKTMPSGRSRLSAVSGEGSGENGAASMDTPSSGATIFHRGDRPTIMPEHSFVVKGGKSPSKASSYDTRLSWKSFNENIPRFPTVSSIPSMPSMPEMPSIPFMKSRDSARKQHSMPIVTTPDGVQADDLEQPSASKKVEERTNANLSKQKLADLHAKHPNLRDLSRPLLPIAVFPNQGTGKSSEFNQEAPIWSRQPFKLLYFAYFGLSVGLIFLPWFAITSLFKSQRARPTWDWKRSTLVKLYRHGARLTFRTHTSLSRDLSKEVPHSKTVRAKFVWVDGLADELIKGHVRAAMKLQNLRPTRTCGFWYGERDGGGGVGQPASAGEKVIYHLHGGAYWIGTAHEKDVTSAVNMQALRALDAIYDSRLPKTLSQDRINEADTGKEPRNSSPHPPPGGPATTQEHSSGGHCKRAFSLDYRLCVPGRPEMGSYPAALLDALAGYRYLTEECGFAYENIIVAGDSAGGNLALAMCRYLRDEKLYGMPGAMILLSPWADASRSHSGPSTCPNKFNSNYKNRHTDIISPSMAFRNTAVSALLGRLPASETYRNPYLSCNSLQLPTDMGGSGPNWGFEGFPRRIYICTGSAEISYDQHLTLAYRLAGGTVIGRPIHSGDQLSVNADSYEMAARLCYPRPQDCEITLWPSAHNIPAGTPLFPPAEWGSEVNGEELFTSHIEQGPNEINQRLKSANGYFTKELGGGTVSIGESANGTGVVDQSQADQSTAPSTDAAAAHDTKYEAGKGPNESPIKEKDTEKAAGVTHEHNHDKYANLTGKMNGAATNGHADPNAAATDGSRDEQLRKRKSSRPGSDPTYANPGREDRTVVLDECKDAVHDYTLFNWYEPERGQTWARIAKWIDEEV